MSPSADASPQAQIDSCQDDDEVLSLDSPLSANDVDSDSVQDPEEMIELHSAASINKSIAKAYVPTRTNDSQVNLFDSLPDSASCPTFGNADIGSVQTSGEIIELISAVSLNEVIADHNAPPATQDTEPVPPGSIQLLTTNGGLSLPQELTLSILEMLKADDQIETLANFQQCSQSCQELVRPVIWDEMIVSMRGLSIIWDWLFESPQANHYHCRCCANRGLRGQLWGDLTRVKKLRVVGVGHKHVKKTFAASLDDAMAGWRKRDAKYNSAVCDYGPLHRARAPGLPIPFDSLEHVMVTVTVGAQLFDQMAVHWLLYPTMTHDQRWHVELWQYHFTMPLLSTAILRQQPIPTVDVQMPPDPKNRNIRCELVGDGDVATDFYSHIQGLTTRSQAFQIHDLETEGTDAQNCIPHDVWDKQCFITYRMPSSKEAWNFAETVRIFFMCQVHHLLDTLCREINGQSLKPTTPPTLSVRIPSSRHGALEAESLYSMNDRHHLKNLAEDWPLSRKYAWVVSKTIEICSEACFNRRPRRSPAFVPKVYRPSQEGVTADDFGKEGLFGKACQRVYLDLSGLDDLEIDEKTAHLFSIQSLTRLFDPSE